MDLVSKDILCSTRHSCGYRLQSDSQVPGASISKLTFIEGIHPTADINAPPDSQHSFCHSARVQPVPTTRWNFLHSTTF